MIFFFDSDGNLFRSVPETVYQGSNAHNKLYVIAPFSQSSVVTVAFRLPNGKQTVPSLCTLTPATGGLADYIDANSQNSLYVWAVDIPAWVTDYAGNVTAQFYIMDGQTQVATASVQFAVLQGVAPSVPSDDNLDSVLSRFEELVIAWGTYKEQISSLVDGLYDKKAIVAIFTCASSNARSVTLTANTLTLDRIDWGDGTINTALTHTYALAGTYVCKIYATAWTDAGEYGAFANVLQLVEVFLSNALPAIPDVTFIGCQNLRKVHFADNTTIGEQAFQECYNLAEIDLPKTITTIGYRAFYNSGVETLLLWNTITSVGTDAFDQTAIDKIYFKGFKSELPLDLDDFVSVPTIYYLSEGKESDNETEIYNIKSYIPTGTSAVNKLVNESDIDEAVEQAMGDNFVSTTKTTPQAVQGDFTIGGDAVIVGNLTVQGTEYINDVETIQSENTLIITNYSEEGAALTTLSGVVAITGEKENDEYPAIAVAVYDPADETLKLGTGTYTDGEFTPDDDLQPLATRRESTDMTDGNLVKWNAEDNTLEDAGVAITAADKAAWNAKQNALTFDDAPTQNSDNPVKSGGVYTALQGKVDKTTTAWRVYGTASANEQVAIPYSDTRSANSIAQRGDGGTLAVGEPTANDHATTKKYVDDNLPVIQDWTV